MLKINCLFTKSSQNETADWKRLHKRLNLYMHKKNLIGNNFDKSFTNINI